MLREEDDMGKVTVAIKLDVVPLLEGVLAETKATMEPDLIDPSLDDDVRSDMQIHDFTILQFDGVTGDAVLKGGGISHYDHWPLHGYDASLPGYDPDDVVKLSASATPNTIVVLANTYEDPLDAISEGMKLTEFLAADFSTISSLSDVFTTIGGDNYLRMSGSVCTAIGSSTTIVVPLKRNVAKIVINVNNTSSGDDVVSLSSVQLKSINDKYYYLAHIAGDLESADPPASFIDPYSSIDPHRFDDDVQTFPDAKNASGAVETYTFYVPANLRGEPTENLLQYNKGKYAVEGATYFRIFGKYPHGENDYTPIEYTYYLGGDLTKNFDIKPNYKYTYNITITGRGDSRYDYRIDDMSEKVFTTDANCYMLHPPQESGQSRIYAFPVRRAAVFWNSEGVNLGLYGASNMSGYEGVTMGYDTPWTAEVVWSDFDMSGYMITDSEDPAYKDRFLQVASGTGFDPENPSHSQPYIKVKVHNGMEGNVVVAVKKGDTILWSWHLWITDYDPDVYGIPVDGTYIYEAINGQIHRINNDLWKTKASEDKVGYADGFIMDRNLGSFSPAYSATRGLYYQFGRKDPFNSYNRFYYGGTSYSTSFTTINWQSTGVEGNFNIRYSVNHPAVFIISAEGLWTSYEDDMGNGAPGSSNPRWYDRKYLEHKGNQTVLEIKKSIYDPCPPGWAVPDADTFLGFSLSSQATIVSGTYTTVWADNGRYYYPEGYVNAARTGVAGFYPAAGFRYYSTGRITHPGGMSVKGSTGYYWLNGNGGASNTGSIIYMYSTYMAPKFGNYSQPAFGFPVRCVRE